VFGATLENFKKKEQTIEQNTEKSKAIVAEIKKTVNSIKDNLAGAKNMLDSAKIRHLNETTSN